MATKDSRRQVREIVEDLELRVHRGPAVEGGEIQSARDFLHRNGFPPASGYFHRLAHLEDRLHQRMPLNSRPAKRNYGGSAGGCLMQVQSVYDHLILSTCYAGEYNRRRGRIKISHRFNEHGRIDFVELKYLKSLDPLLHGELRKLLMVKDYSSIQKDWFAAEAFVLKTLPRELVFLYPDIFRCRRAELFAWLLNVGHGIGADLLKSLSPRRCLSESAPARNGDQLPLLELRDDDLALSILKQAANLESSIEVDETGETEAIVRYSQKRLS